MATLLLKPTSSCHLWVKAGVLDCTTQVPPDLPDFIPVTVPWLTPFQLHWPQAPCPGLEIFMQMPAWLLIFA